MNLLESITSVASWDRILADRFGLPSFHPWQREAIDALGKAADRIEATSIYLWYTAEWLHRLGAEKRARSLFQKLLSAAPQTAAGQQRRPVLAIPGEAGQIGHKRISASG